MSVCVLCLLCVAADSTPTCVILGVILGVCLVYFWGPFGPPLEQNARFRKSHPQNTWFLNENGAPDPPRTDLLPRNEKERKNSKNSGSLDPPPPPQVGAKNHKKSVSEHPECNVVDQRFTFDVIFDGSGFVTIF